MKKLPPGIFLVFLVVACTYHNTDSQPTPDITFSCDTILWENHIRPIMTSSCATSGCHDGVSRLDWRDYDMVKKYAALVKEKTQDRSMPADSRLTKLEIDLIACWVDKGAPEN